MLSPKQQILFLTIIGKTNFILKFVFPNLRYPIFAPFAFPYNVKQIPLPPSFPKFSKSILFCFLGSSGMQQFWTCKKVFYSKAVIRYLGLAKLVRSLRQIYKGG